MKFFKCGKCQTPYKVDETKFTTSQVMVKCVKCGTKNIIRFGPVLTAQSQGQLRQFPLKEGDNLIGRAGAGSTADIVIDDKYVSRKHAIIRIEKVAEKIFVTITDCGSRNGTFDMRKDRLKPGIKQPFLPDDYFIIGLTKITFKFN